LRSKVHVSLRKQERHRRFIAGKTATTAFSFFKSKQDGFASLTSHGNPGKYGFSTLDNHKGRQQNSIAAFVANLIAKITIMPIILTRRCLF
jgi:hypothetical protein